MLRPTTPLPRYLAAAGLCAVLSLAACGSSTSGSGNSAAASGSSESAAASPTSASTPASSSSVSSVATSDSPEPGLSSGSLAGGSPADELTSAFAHGLASISSAHADLTITTAGKHITAVGVERLHDGKVTALDLAETLPGIGSLRLIIIDDKLYLNLPAALRKSSGTAKPWVLATQNSTNPTVKAVATSLASTKNSASLASFVELIQAASTVRKLGPKTINGVQTTPFPVVVSVAKLPADFPNRSALTSTGLTSIPVTIFLDSQDRPVRVIETITVSKQKVATQIDLTKYNAPVSISAPPAGQVSR